MSSLSGSGPSSLASSTGSPLPVFVITGETAAERAESEKGVRHQIGFYGSTPNYRALLEHHGYDTLGKELSAATRAGEFAPWLRLRSSTVQRFTARPGRFVPPAPPRGCPGRPSLTISGHTFGVGTSDRHEWGGSPDFSGSGRA